jgi:lipoyl(octanoyl) transferase
MLGFGPGWTTSPIARNEASSSRVLVGATRIFVNYPPLVSTGAYLLDAGLVSYREALELQRSIAAAVTERTARETVILVEHPAVITTGRRTGEGEVHLPQETAVEVIETNRGGKSTFHGPGQLVCYPILDLNRHGKDLKRYVRDLEQAIIGTVAPFDLPATTIEGLTGVWLEAPPRKLASIGIHVSRWVTTHGFALNVDLDPAPFTAWITACGLEDAQFTTMSRELGRSVSIDEVKPAAIMAMGEVFGLEFEALVPTDVARIATLDRGLLC